MKFPRQPVEPASIDLTPLIDVVFLLLIFFMVSTTFVREREMTVELPEASVETAAVETPGRLEIEISTQGEYAINQQRLVNRDADTLSRALKDASQGNTGMPLVITADAATPHQAVVTAMDVSGKLGFTHLRITTRQPEKEKP